VTPFVIKRLKPIPCLRPRKQPKQTYPANAKAHAGTMPFPHMLPCIQTTAIADRKNNAASNPIKSVDFPYIVPSWFLTRIRLNRIRQTVVATISRHATIGMLQNKTISIQIAGLDGGNVIIGANKKQNIAESIHGTVNASVAWKNAPFAGSSQKKILERNCFIVQCYPILTSC